jgi:preprotein translocase subunit SecG
VHILNAVLTSLLILTSIFLICLVLIQRGKGGGLAGALGGMGGSSAFGTKAGDIFTRVTMITAVVWILLNMLLVVLYNRGTGSAWDEGAPRSSASRAKEVAPTGTGTSTKTGKTTGTGTGAAAPASEPKSKESTPAPAAPPPPVSVPAVPPPPVSVPAIPDK